jgi:hypothetical protein
MKLTLVRRWFGPHKTISKLYVNGLFRYYVLEDLVRDTGEAKVYGQTAIPYGKYPVSVSHSPKLGRELPMVENVPGFTGIRIHAGVDEKWTAGCLLISRKIEGGKLVLDRQAEAEITDIIKNALHYRQPVTLTVINSQRRALIVFGIILFLLAAAYILFLFFPNIITHNF